MTRSAGRALLIAVALLCASCQTVEDPFPPQSAINVDVTFSGIGSQLSAPPTPQVVVWTIADASVTDLTGTTEPYSFLRTPPCFYPLNVVALRSLSNTCRLSGLTVRPAVERTGTIEFRFTSMELRQAARPDLRLGADPDGDGFPNGFDNCPSVPNPDQKNSNSSSETTQVGDACSANDSAGNPTVPDYDLDGVANGVDNCTWYPNPFATGETSQPDADRDGIGDACERVARVILPAEGLHLACDVKFTGRAAIPSIFRLDFARAGVLTCDLGFTACSIDPTQILLTLSGSTDTFPCKAVP